MRLKIEVDEDRLEVAVKVARSFDSEYPDRVGIHHCVVYGDFFRGQLIAYRTATGAICVKQSKGTN